MRDNLCAGVHDEEGGPERSHRSFLPGRRDAHQIGVDRGDRALDLYVCVRKRDPQHVGRRARNDHDSDVLGVVFDCRRRTADHFVEACSGFRGGSRRFARRRLLLPVRSDPATANCDDRVDDHADRLLGARPSSSSGREQRRAGHQREDERDATCDAAPVRCGWSPAATGERGLAAARSRGRRSLRVHRVRGSRGRKLAAALQDPWTFVNL